MAYRIMIQGTSSDAGKSFLCTALLRALKNRGIKAAPFKSQNMSNNSRVSSEGHEVGVAQVVQAEAAGAPLSSRMNPILLKPSSDKGSQVLFRGKSFGHLSAEEYQNIKGELKADIINVYQELESQYDCIVIEGAGSPAEINLREEDLVNMGLASSINAPVILVADIDRGGVFASLYGTYALLSEEEKARVVGYVINKFRGEQSLLLPGIEQMKEYFPVQCLGVIPYTDISIDMEDSLSLQNALHSKTHVHIQDSKLEDGIDIAIVKLNHIANICDYDNFERFENVSLRYVTKIEEIEGKHRPDILILPGTKASVKDMQILNQSGMAQAIKNYINSNGFVFGLCGGLQMLGKYLRDPNGIEGEALEVEGLAAFPYETHFIDTKTQCLTSCTFENMNFYGYEIHNGVSRLIHNDEDYPISTNIVAQPKREDSLLNFSNDTKRIFATYLHGIFDDDAALEYICKCACPHVSLRKKAHALESLEAFKDNEYEKLAKLVEEHLDIDMILQIAQEFK